MRNIGKIFAAIIFALALPCLAQAQSNPGWGYKDVPTPAQWNAQWSSKQDWLGAPPILTTGGTLTGPLITVPSTASISGLNIPAGAAPTSPNNGDFWSTSAGFFGRVNGSTVGPFVSTATIGDATNSAKGISQCDGVTITCSGGVITAIGAAATSIAVGSTTISSGTSGNILYDNAGTLGNIATTGTGNVVLSASPTLTGTATLAAATFSGLVQVGTSNFESNGNVMTFPTTTATLARTDTGQTFTGTNTFGAVNLNAGGALSGTFSGSPTLSGSNFVTLANLTQSTAGAQFLGVTGASAGNYAPFTLASLPNLAAPNATFDLIPCVDHTTGTIKNCTPSGIAASVVSGVSSYNLLTGAVAGFASDKRIYVSTSGNDINNGLSPESAKLTLQAAVNAANPGGTVDAGAGIFTLTSTLAMQPGVTLTCSPGTIITQGNAQNLLNAIDFFTNTATGAQLDHCTIDGNRANNTDNSSVDFVDISTTANVKLTWNTFQNIPGVAVGVNGGQYVTIEHNICKNLHDFCIGLSGTVANTALHAQVHYNTAIGPYSNCIYVLQTDYNDISHNDCNPGVVIGGRNAMNVTISGTSVSWVSGVNFTGATPGQILVVNGGTELTIAVVTSPIAMTTTTSGGSLTNVRAAIGAADQISLNNPSYNRVCENTINGGATGGIVLSNESASTESLTSNIICNNTTTNTGAWGIAIEGSASFGTTFVLDTILIGNHVTDPGQAGVAGVDVGGYQLYSASSGRVNGMLIDGNYALDQFTQTGGYWLTGSGQNLATNVTFGFNHAKGFANNFKMNGYPTFASLPVSAIGKFAYIIDGNASFCGDSSCTTWGTIVTAGGGLLPLFLFNDGGNFTLAAK
jgi:hypothetical protein